MQDKTINNALLALRKQITRNGDDGLEHVEALLGIRGVDMPRVLPSKPANSARQGQMARLILDAMSDRPMTRLELVRHIAEKLPDVPPERVYYRTDAALNRLRLKGRVAREGLEWRLCRPLPIPFPIPADWRAHRI